MKLAHIVHSTVVRETSDLFIAQPITYQTMIEAKRLAASQVQVELFAACFPEGRALAPAEFIRTLDLEKSVQDCGEFDAPGKLPLIKDILDRLYEATTADYLLYTNVDIGLQPYFYVAVGRLIEEGYDTFSINRRTVSKRFKRVDEIPLMWAEEGSRHDGHDCFVFPRALYPKFRLSRVCIGTGGIGRTMLYNFLCHGRRPTLFADKHLTFHIGDDMAWHNPKYRGLYEFNHAECERTLQRLKSEFGEFDATHIGDRKLKTTSSSRRLLRRARSFLRGR